ncbi:MAG: aminotransferase class V-fold PLP-dependent enzyme [Blastocatellia bacterium]|nr:aminotransferase class V-fold PLP-dependent enzyme [Blastocatellia bacterium]
MLLPLQRNLFELPDDVVYLNCANMSPQLRSVSDAGLQSVVGKAMPWTLTSADWLSGSEILRGLAAQVIGASPDTIALIPAASYGIAIAAANVRVERGQSIVLLQEEYPSNYYAWRELARQRGAEIRTVKRTDGSWTESIIEAIDDRTAVVSVPNCHWTDGSLIDLERVGEQARAAGAALVVDASQSLGAYPLEIEKVQPDFLVSVGYKWLLGPYALGYLYASPSWCENGQPIEYSWLARAESENFSRLVEYRDEYRRGARRFDMGEFPNFVLAPMAIAALQQVLEWKIENIRQTLAGLTGLIAAKGAELGCTFPSEHVDHLIGVRLPRGIPAELGEQLAAEKVFVSIRGDAIRIAPHLYNDQSDIEKFFAVLRRLI